MSLSERRDELDKLMGLKSPYIKKRKKLLGISNGTSSSNNLDKQIANYKTRLEASGIEEKDKRSPIAQFLNLPKDQNIIFDTFDIINRPFNALKGGIQEVQEGGNFLEGASSGLGIGKNSDYKEYYAGDILRNLGVSDKKLFTNPINQDDVSVADIAGTFADIFMDPMDAAIWASTVPTGGATAPLAAARTGNKLVNTADTIADVAKATKTTDNLADAAKGTTTVRKSTLELLAGLGAKGVKKTANLADTGLTKGLQKLDNTRAASWAKKGADARTINENLVSLADTYSGLKKGVTSTIDYTKALPGNVVNNTRETNAAIEGARLQATNKAQQLRKASEEYAQNSQVYRNADEVDTAINRLIESQKSVDSDLNYVFKKAIKSKGNKYKIQGTTESVENAFKEMTKIERLNKANILSNPVSIGNGMSEITIFKKAGTDLDNLKTIASNKTVSDALKNIKITRPSRLTEDVTQELTKAQNLLKTDPEFKKLYESSSRILPDFADEVYEATGGRVDLRDIVNRPGYARKELEESALKASGIDLGSEYSAALKGNRRVLGSGSETKYQKYTTDEAEIVRKEAIQTGVKNRETAIKRINSQLPENKYNKLKQQLDKTKETMTQYDVQFKDNLKRAKLSQEKTTKILKIKQAELDSYSDVVSKEAKNTIRKLSDPSNADKYVKAANNFTLKHDKLVKEMEKLTQDGLSGNEIRNITKNIENYQQSLAKAHARVDIEKAKLDGFLTQRAQKEANRVVKAVEKSSKLKEQTIKLATQESAKTSKIANIESARESVITGLQKTINNLEMKIENTNPNLPENLKITEKLLQDITDKTQEISLLKSIEGQKLFTNSYFGGVEDFLSKVPDQAKNIQTYDNIIFRAGLSDTNVIRFLDETQAGVKAPIGYRKLTPAEVTKINNYLGTYSKLVPEDTLNALDSFNRLAKNSKEILIDQDAYDLLRINGQFNDANVGLFLKTVNGFTNTFRKYSTFSLGYQMRNVVGNFSNAVLSGVPMTKLTSEFAHADNLLKNDNMWKLLNKATDGTSVLTKAEKADVELVKDFIKAGFLGQGAKVRDLQDVLNKVQNTSQYRNKAKKLIDDIFKLNVKGNEWLDAHSRLAVLAYARKNPSYVAKLNASSPIDAVKKVLFDPTNMSAVERNVFKKFVPFYTFTKQNLLFQMSNMIKNTSKYNRLYKAFDTTYESLDKNQYRDYQKSTMNIPIYTDEEGNLTTIKTNLPASDVGEWFNSPEDFIRRAVSSSTPLIKTPFEIATGVDPFTGYESNKTPLEHLAGLFGVQNLTTNVPGRIQKLQEGGTASNQFADLIPSVATYNDAKKIANQNQYQEYLDYQAYIKSLKEQGINVPTLTELEEQGIDIDVIRDRITGTNNALKKLQKQREELLKSFR